MKTYFKALVIAFALSSLGLSAVFTNKNAEQLRIAKERLAEVEKSLETATRPLRRESLEKTKKMLEQEIAHLEQQDVTD